MSRVTSNGTGHTLQVESTYGLGHPIKWVAPWVRSVPIESLDSPRSNHVASYEGYMTCTTTILGFDKSSKMLLKVFISVKSNAKTAHVIKSLDLFYNVFESL